MERPGQGVRYWALASAALMVVGAFGPWVKALGISVGGTDGSNDGWLVVVVAAVGGLLFYATRRDRGAGLWALLGGAAGTAITLYDRSHVQHAIADGGLLGQAVVQVGWGLNLALIASISFGLAGIVRLAQGSETAAAPAPLPSNPSARTAATEPPPTTPPSVPTPPPD